MRPQGRNNTTSYRIRRDSEALQRFHDLEVSHLSQSLTNLSLRPAATYHCSQLQHSPQANNVESQTAPKRPSSQSRMHLDLARDIRFLCREFGGAQVSFNPILPRLVFFHDPLRTGPAILRAPEDMVVPNRGVLTLLDNDSSNADFLKHELYCYKMVVDVEALPRPSDPDAVNAMQNLVDRLYDEIYRLEVMKAHEWERRRTSNGLDLFFKTDKYFPNELPACTAEASLLQSCNLLVLMLYLFFQLPHRSIRILLAGMRSISRLAVAYTETTLGMHIPPVDAASQPIKQIWEQIPKRIEGIIASAGLDPKLRSFVCCSECFALYIREECPITCNYKETPTSAPCDEKLWRIRVVNGVSHQRPKLEYHHQDMHAWLARLLSRPGIEEAMDSITVPVDPPQFTTDFWDAEVIRTFKGPANQTTAYMDTTNATPGTARLVFALAADGFNPFQSKPGKGSVTSTGIYMVCLNLPPHLRYLPENIYLVGIIPGKPSKDQINHYLKLVVDDLMPLWLTGIFFSRTAKYHFGRWVNAALVPIVADILAARQLMAIGSHSMKFFCSCCYLRLEDIENFQPSTWPLRDLAFHRRAAEAWRDASSTEQREALFEETGVRWTELLRLPYFDVLQFTVIDSMHNHYLGLFQDHCREIWGMDASVLDGDGFGSSRKEPLLPSPQAMESGRYYLLYGSENQLRTNCVKAVLWHLCLQRGIRRAGTVNQLIRNLIQWRTRQGLPTRPPVSTSSISVARPTAILNASGTGQTFLQLPTQSTSPLALSNISSISSSPNRNIPVTRTQDTSPAGSAGPSSIRTQHPTSQLPITRSASFGQHSFTPQPVIMWDSLPADIAPYSNELRLTENAWITGRPLKYFQTKRRALLQYMCLVRGLSEAGTCKDLAARLIAKRDNPGSSQSPTVVPISTTPSTSAPIVRNTSVLPTASGIVPPGSHTNPNEGVRSSENGANSSSSALPFMNSSAHDLPVVSESSQGAISALRPDVVVNIARNDNSTMPNDSVQRHSQDRRGPVLGRDNLAAVHADLTLTKLPTWVSSAPNNFGSKTRGKLTADQWRTVCMIHLPITLIRLWGPAGGHQKAMLDNFMDLVSAVEIGGSLRTSEEYASLYEQLMLRYLRGMTHLYRGASVKPNHHLAVHLASFLRRFGPVHSWRSFAFERFNYMLQRLNVNMRIGQVERTFMTTCCRAANLRPMLRTEGARKTIGEALEVYDLVLLEDGRGTRNTDNRHLAADLVGTSHETPTHTNSDLVVLDSDVYSALLSALNEGLVQPLYVDRQARVKASSQVFLFHKAQHLAKICIGGVTYAPRSKNAHLLLLRGGSLLTHSCSYASSTHAATLIDIFAHERKLADNSSLRCKEIFLVVRVFAPLSPQHIPADIFRQYPVSGGYLCYARYMDSCVIVRPSVVVSHFGCTPVQVGRIDEACIHVRPLDRLLKALDPSSLRTSDEGDETERT